MGTKQTKTVTLTSIAKKAGVSRSIASRAVHNQSRLSSKSKTKVFKAMKELGYKIIEDSNTGQTLALDKYGKVFKPQKGFRGKKTIQNPEETKAYEDAIFKDIDEPCPECSHTQIEFIRGDGRTRYWCSNIYCFYIKPIFPGEKRRLEGE